uniref:Scavenger receptor class F member 1 n=1 Tax=Nothoprocta perdicaria TaxID=30464 RepID=A0A8C7E8E0_NOTPE
WKQQGRECTEALCEGAESCGKDEVCVRPGLCLCKPGFFGADCSSRCPEQYWGPDCKRRCPCHPGGTCEAASGRCTCLPGRWGARCESTCACGAHGRCEALSGACRCEAGWWGPACDRQCQCNPGGSRCDPHSGHCRCLPGWWGRRCSFKCSCNASPCAQETGKCECRAGWWGPACQRRCDCLHGACSPLSGHCSCSPGYQGRSCREPCPPGKYGPQCVHSCPRCRDGGACDAESGTCAACEPGWAGARYRGPAATAFGVRASPASRQRPAPRRAPAALPVLPAGAKDHAAVAAAVLVPLLLLLLCGACCCCGAGHADARDRAAAADDGVVSRMKHHVRRVLANLSALMPCVALGGSKLPKVTVSHHDAEIPFNPSFIEPPSAAWVSDSSFSSFDTDNEGPEYSVPPREGDVDGAPASTEALPDPSAFSSEDVSQPFAIPRTSSLAKAKRPSVSFAEGTKFGPQGRGSAAEAPPDSPSGGGTDSPEPTCLGEEGPRGRGRRRLPEPPRGRRPAAASLRGSAGRHLSKKKDSSPTLGGPGVPFSPSQPFLSRRRWEGAPAGRDYPWHSAPGALTGCPERLGLKFMLAAAPEGTGAGRALLAGQPRGPSSPWPRTGFPCSFQAPLCRAGANVAAELGT